MKNYELRGFSVLSFFFLSLFCKNTARNRRIRIEDNEGKYGVIHRNRNLLVVRFAIMINARRKFDTVNCSMVVGSGQKQFNTRSFSSLMVSIMYLRIFNISILNIITDSYLFYQNHILISLSVTFFLFARIDY